MKDKLNKPDLYIHIFIVCIPYIILKYLKYSINTNKTLIIEATTHFIIDFIKTNYRKKNNITKNNKIKYIKM